MLFGNDGWLLKTDLSPAKTIFWFPSDGGGGMPMGCEQILNYVDRPIAMAQFGQKQSEKVYGIKTGHIPHAIDVENYAPLKKEERDELREKMGLKDKFIIGVVARNQGRKMLDRTIKIMAEYAKINPNAILFLHCDPNDPAQVFPIRSLIQRFGLENRVIFSGMRFYSGLNYKEMKNIYGIMDVFLLTTSGEGFGIPLIEAEACKVPVLATDYTTTRELVINSNAGLGINLVGTDENENPEIHGAEVIDGSITGSWAVERGICSIKDGVKKLDYLYKNPKERSKMGNAGRLNVIENFNWDKLKYKWFDLVDELGGQY